MSDEKTAKRRVTLRDVAQAAGVSLKTASNVINGSGRMTDETRAKVESVIKDLDYRVNVAARNLNRDHTGFITLAVPSLIPPYLAELANRTIEAARQRDYSRIRHHVCGRLRERRARSAEEVQLHGVRWHDPFHERGGKHFAR